MPFTKSPRRDDEATVDHVYHRFDPRRHLPGGGLTVLACLKCNYERAAWCFANMTDVRVAQPQRP